MGEFVSKDAIGKGLRLQVTEGTFRVARHKASVSVIWKKLDEFILAIIETQEVGRQFVGDL